MEVDGDRPAARTGARRASGRSRASTGEIDVTYLRNGGVLQTVLRRLAAIGVSAGLAGAVALPPADASV